MFILLISLILIVCGVQLYPFYPKIGDILGVVGVTTLLIIVLSFGFEFIVNTL